MDLLHRGLKAVHQLSTGDFTRRQLAHGPFRTAGDRIYDERGYNQTGRFNNATMLVRYVCTGDGMFSGGLQGGLNKDSWEHFYVYDPVCKFPYVNKGWYRHWSGVVPPGGENVTNPERYYGDDCR
jgi:hypothetical protein|tara:strand:- start:132 stop:506 length:375 start_codon:yes stop_codon:yes gene_type:complete